MFLRRPPLAVKHLDSAPPIGTYHPIVPIHSLLAGQLPSDLPNTCRWLHQSSAAPQPPRFPKKLGCFDAGQVSGSLQRQRYTPPQEVSQIKEQIDNCCLSMLSRFPYMSTNPDTGATVAVVGPIPILTEALSGHPGFTRHASFSVSCFNPWNNPILKALLSHRFLVLSTHKGVAGRRFFAGARIA